MLSRLHIQQQTATGSSHDARQNPLAIGVRAHLLNFNVLEAVLLNSNLGTDCIR